MLAEIMFMWDWKFWVLFWLIFGPGVLVGWTGRGAWIEHQREARRLENQGRHDGAGDWGAWLDQPGAVTLLDHAEDMLGEDARPEIDRPYDWADEPAEET